MQLAIDKVINFKDLTEEEMRNSMNIIMEGRATSTQIGGFLTGLRMKGETIEEIIGATKVMREKAEKIEIDHDYTVDTCGTGGDQSNTFNISTTAAFVAAAGSVTVVKHGNRSVSSKCGSADVLEMLGVNIDLPSEKVKKCIDELQIGFIFAPKFHQTMKFAINPRRELGTRTIFNVLGPLTNPANPRSQVLGVFNKNLTKTLAEVLAGLGLNKGMVVHGLDGLDEITITTKTKVSEIKEGKVHEYYLDPRDYGISLNPIERVQGGSPKENAEILLDVLRGEKGPKRDMVLLNAGAAIYVGGKASSLEEGIEKSREIIDRGHALDKLNQLIKLTQELGS